MVFVRSFLFSLLAISVFYVNKVEPQENPEIVLEYEWYLREVIQLLESDKEFSKKIENATEEDIMTGKIAKELVHVHSLIRLKLNDLKRAELERLHKLSLEEENSNQMILPEYINYFPQTFEIDDLAKLLIKSSKDLAG